MFDMDAFKKREQALEDEFFHRVDEKLRAEIRRSMQRDRSREALAAATGLSDEELLDALVDSGFEATTLAALALVPAVFVAWADHSVTQLEHDAILKAAAERGLSEDGLASQLLEQWLITRPPRSLWDTWKRYATSVGESLSDTAAGVLTTNILHTATVVAEASGGILGFGKVSSAEQEVLDQIKEVLS
jgi:hypothetical protein